MVYVALSDLEGRIPPAFLTQALDDDGDGAIDAWDAVALSASQMVEGILAPRYATPFATPTPPVVTLAAQVFAGELIYQRRSVGNDVNPFHQQAETMRNTLNQIALGKMPLQPGVERVNKSGSTIVEAAPTWSSNGLRMA